MKLIIILLFSLICSACSGKPYIVKSELKSNAIKDKSVYVVSHGWHTGFIIPADDMHKQVPELKVRFPTALYIEFGWGDKGFYQASEITTCLTLRAIFWPTDSIIHAVALTENPVTYFSGSQVEKICLNKENYRSLLLFIENSFFKSRTREVLPLKKGIYGNSQFYKAEGDYYLMNTCNKWTAKGLYSAGLDISTTFKLTSDSIMDFIEGENTNQDDMGIISSKSSCMESGLKIK